MTNEVSPNLVNLQSPVDAALAKFDENDFAARFWKRDATLWSSDTADAGPIEALSGWLDLPSSMKSAVPDLLAPAQSVKEEGYGQIILVAVDESSLPALVLEQALGRVSGYPELTVVNREGEVMGRTPAFPAGPAKTLFVISAANEDMLMMPGVAVLYDRVRQVKKERPGDNFVAITRSGTSLERFARELHFREIFINPPGIAPLYLGLSYSGLVPAALAGYNIGEMLNRAAVMAEECHKPGLENPGLYLGSILGSAQVPNRPGTSLVLTPQIEGFALWADQLVGIETRRNLLPLDETLKGVGVADRLVVSLQLSNQKALPIERMLKKLEDTAHPIVRLRLKDLADLAAEFFRWQFAASVAAALPGLNSAVK